MFTWISSTRLKFNNYLVVFLVLGVLGDVDAGRVADAAVGDISDPITVLTKPLDFGGVTGRAVALVNVGGFGGITSGVKEGDLGDP